MYNVVIAVHNNQSQTDICLFPIIGTRGEVWPGKNHKYFKKRKLDIEF